LKQSRQNSKQSGDDVDVVFRVAKRRQARLANQAPDPENDQQFPQHVEKFVIPQQIALRPEEENKVYVIKKNSFSSQETVTHHITALRRTAPFGKINQ